MNLAAVRIVLVETSHPGNIGAAARAMKTMGLARLVLVAPGNYPSAEATARASGADDVLYRAEVCDDLDRALSGCRLVFGVSARRRGISSPELDPRGCAETLAAFVAGDGGAADTALVFGRERSGLSNDELDRCHYLVRIPSNPDYGSLNLAAAVQVLSYELRLRALAAGGGPENGGSAAPVADRLDAPASADDMERLYAHMQQALLAIGFLNPANPRHLMRRLRRLFNRARPDRREVNILRGILSAAQQGAARPDVAGDRGGGEKAGDAGAPAGADRT